MKKIIVIGIVFSCGYIFGHIAPDYNPLIIAAIALGIAAFLLSLSGFVWGNL